VAYQLHEVAYSRGTADGDIRRGGVRACWEGGSEYTVEVCPNPIAERCRAIHNSTAMEGEERSIFEYNTGLGSSGPRQSAPCSVERPVHTQQPVALPAFAKTGATVKFDGANVRYGDPQIYMLGTLLSRAHDRRIQ
jgi:hypothetical protein